MTTYNCKLQSNMLNRLYSSIYTAEQHNSKSVIITVSQQPAQAAMLCNSHDENQTTGWIRHSHQSALMTSRHGNQHLTNSALLARWQWVCRRLAQRHWWERTATDTRPYCQKVKRKINLYSAPSWEAHLCSAQVWITQFLHCKHIIPAFIS